MRNPGGLRARLAIRAGLLAAGALSVLGVALEFAVVRPRGEEFDREVDARVEELAAHVSAHGAPAFAERAPRWIRTGRDEFACLLRPGGGILLAAGRSPPAGAESLAPGPVRPLRDPVVGEFRTAAREASGPGGKPYVVVGGAAASEIRDRQAETRWVFLAAAAGAVLLVAGGAWVGADLVLDPLGRFAAAARGPGAAAGALRLPVRDPGDEFDDVARILNERFERTRDSLEEERRFAGEAAHELRAPLAVLRLRAEDALAAGDPATARAALEGCLADVDRIHRLVQALLELSRSDPGAAAGARCDLAEVLPPLAADLGSLASSRGATLRAVAPPGPLPVAAPREIVETAVSILVDNALRYGGTGVRVALRPEVRAGGTAILVEDSGPGVPAEEAPRIFDRLYRGRAARAAGGGFGLGLALARRLARSAGGEVALENPGEPGARFAATFPSLPG